MKVDSAMDMMDGTANRVGCRFESEGHYGTVLYQGQVPPTKGEWLGVEWDDVSRGKHDGNHEGTRYFTTRHSTSGSFIRPKKANFGVSFLEEVKEKYGIRDDDNAGVLTEELFVMGKNQHTVVEMVGAKSVNLQQSKLDKLTELGLRSMSISHAGPEGEILARTPNVRELDISKNLISSWAEVARITQQLPKLTSLNVGENQLRLPEDGPALAPAFEQLRTLFMNRVQYNWAEVLQLSTMWPCLKQLHVCFNNIEQLQDPSPWLPNLRLLNLEGNNIGNWEQVLKLGLLTSLETLIVNDTGLVSVSFPDSEAGMPTSYFPSLKSISLSNNKLDNYQSINELNKLRSLEEVNFKRNPLMVAEGEVSVWFMFVARIKRLKMLNRTKIGPQERKGAEIDYLRIFGQEWKNAGGNQDPEKNHPNENFRVQHPRYQELIDQYGAAEDSELVKKSSALKNNLITVNIDSPCMPDKPAITKKLPVTMTVGKLKTLASRLFRVDAVTLYLTYTSDQKEGTEYEFDNDLREIGFYAVDEGDNIHVTWC